MNPVPPSWRAVAAIFLALACAALARAAESPLPTFVRYLGTPANTAPASGAIFVVRWSSPEGVVFEGWARLGERVGEYRLAEFHPKTQTLVLADPQGALHRVALPAGLVREAPAELTDEEFAELSKFMAKGVDRSAAPILSREKARAFYLRYLGQMGAPRDAGVVYDVEGRTLRPETGARWAQDRARSRADGHLRLAVVGKNVTGVSEGVLRPPTVPERMTRNLTDADWEDIAMFEVTNVIQRGRAATERLLKQRQQKSAP
jgi:hypothetical protein